jgi:hypothetical protein
LGDCKYCGGPAGFLRRKHDECERQHLQRVAIIQNGKERICLEVSQAIKGTGNFDNLESTIAEIERSSLVPPTERKSLLVSGWERSVNVFLEDGILDEAEEHRLVEFKNIFSLNDLDRHGAVTKVVKAAVLRDVLNGVISERFVFGGSLPINLQKGEQIVWAFAGSRYLEDKIRREWVGRSQGVSFRVAKGVYYRVGATKGHSVEHTERALADRGWLIITNKHIYFAGPKKSLKIPYSKIVSFQPFSDGIGIMRDAASAKAQFFLKDDGSFTYNLVTNLARL